MPQSTRDEILFTYATLIQPELIKTAWGWNDLLTTFGLDAVGLGVGAGIGATTGTGALIGAVSVGSGGTIPIVIGAALLIGGLGYGIYNLYKLTDENLESLISRLGALDGNQKAQPYINGLIKDLEAHKRSMDGMALVTGTDEEKAQQLVSQLKLIGGVVEYLKTKLQREWPGIKENLTDWGRDPAEAEVAINKTIPAIEAEYKKLSQQLQENTKKVIQEYSAKSGQNYINIANEIVELYNKITGLNGNKPPQFDNPTEDYAWKLVQIIIGKDESKSVTQDELKQGAASLLSLKTALQQAIDYLSKKPSAKTSANKPPISKRALVLSDGKRFGPTVPGVGKQRISARNPTVESIQKLINAFRQDIPDRGVLDTDGIFGPKSAESLNALMANLPQIADSISKQVAVTGRDALNYKELSKNQDKLEGINQALSDVYETLVARFYTPADFVAFKEVKTQREPVGQCKWDVGGNLDDNEIESCLRAIVVQEEGRERMDASRWLKQYNYSTSKERAEVVRSQLSKADGTLPEDWTNQVKKLVWDIKKVHPTQPGPGQFDFSGI